MEDNTRWPTVLPRIQCGINNSKSGTSKSGATLTPNETAYGFSPNSSIDLSEPPPGIVESAQAIARITTADAIAFA